MAKSLGKEKPHLKKEYRSKQEAEKPEKSAPYESRKTLSEEMGLSAEEIAARYEALRRQMNETDMDYAGYVSRVADLRGAANGSSQMDAMNRFYHFQMLASCVQPFMDGMNVDSISRAGGTFLGAYLCSKNFRKMIKEELIDGNAERKTQKQLSRLERQQEKYGGTLPPDKQARHDALVVKLNGGRTPYSPRSAALTHLGFAQQAYRDMRRPGANVDEIEHTYNAAVKSLYETAAKDGCSMKEVARSFRTAVGLAAEKDPSVNSMFSETCYGGCRPSVVKAGSETVMTSAGPSTVEYHEFSGRYQTSDGKPFDGVFHLRRPQSMNEHIGMFEQHVKDAFARSEGDGAAFARRYDDMCKDAGVWKAAIHDDIPDVELEKLQYSQMYDMSAGWTQTALDGNTPQLQERQAALDAEESAAVVYEREDIECIRQEVMKEYELKLESIHDKMEASDDKHQMNMASLETRRASARTPDQQQAIASQIKTAEDVHTREMARFERQLERMEEQREAEIKKRTASVTDGQKQRQSERDDIASGKETFGRDFMDEMHRLHPDMESVAAARHETMDRSRGQDFLSRCGTYEFDEPDNSDDGFEYF